MPFWDMCVISTGAVIIETASSYYRDPWPFPECSNLVSNHAKDSKKATGSHTIFSLPVYLTFQIIFLNCPRLVSDTLDFQNFLRENISHQNELELLKSSRKTMTEIVNWLPLLYLQSESSTILHFICNLWKLKLQLHNTLEKWNWSQINRNRICSLVLRQKYFLCTWNRLKVLKRHLSKKILTKNRLTNLQKRDKTCEVRLTSV